jgi:hypothetical protein
VEPIPWSAAVRRPQLSLMNVPDTWSRTTPAIGEGHPTQLRAGAVPLPSGFGKMIAFGLGQAERPTCWTVLKHAV